VRSKEHARQLTTTGSGRIKKAAFGLEEPLSELGDLLLKLIMNNDKTRLRTVAGVEFIAGQIDEDVDVRVAGHSHSPLFIDDTKELAAELMKFSAIDREELLRMLNPPGVENKVQRLRQIEAQEQAARAQGLDPPGNTKGEQEAKRSHHGRSHTQ
jgi:hypothetical protein